MNDELYQKKSEYEKLINNLNNILSKLDICYTNMISCKKKINNTLKVNELIYDYKKYEKIINNVDDYRNKIRNKYLPLAKKNYNNILSELSKL